MEEDRVLFMLIDWKTELSVRNHVPNVTKGQVNQIPKAWLAFDDNPRGIILRSKLWRCLTPEEQKEQVKKMQMVTKNTQQMNYLKGNLDMLEVQCKDVIEGGSEWNEIAEDEPTSFFASVLNRPLRTSNPLDIVGADMVQHFNKHGISSDSQKKSRPSTTNTAPSTSTAMTTASNNCVNDRNNNASQQPPPPPANDTAMTNACSAPSQVTPLGNLDSNAEAGDDDDDDVESGTGHVTRASDQAARNMAADQAEKSASAGVRHARGVPCEKVSSQSDSVSCKTMDFAMRKVALAADAICCPNRSEKQPRRCFVLLEINEAQDTVAHSGNLTQSNCRRKQTACTVVGPKSHRQFCCFLQDWCRIIAKHDGPKDNTAVLNEFYPDEDGLCLPAVEEHIASRKALRKQPPKKQSAARETVARIHSL